jgi:hypothetical protein
MLQSLYSFAANCNLSCFSCDVSFWTTCTLYGFRCKLIWRILWTIICDICYSALAQIDFFILCINPCIHHNFQAMQKDVLFHTASLSQLLIPSLNALVIRWSHTILMSKFMSNSSNGSKFAYHNMVYAFCCMVDIVLTAQNTWSELLCIQLGGTHNSHRWNWAYNCTATISIIRYIFILELQMFRILAFVLVHPLFDGMENEFSHFNYKTTNLYKFECVYILTVLYLCPRWHSLGCSFWTPHGLRTTLKCWEWLEGRKREECSGYMSMRFSSELNGPCSDERGFTEEVTGSHFDDETVELDLLSTTLQFYRLVTLSCR